MWVEELKNKGPKEVTIVIVGNKSDLIEQREIDQNIATKYAEDIGALYIEASAKDGTNVQEIFIELVGRLPSIDSNALRDSMNNNIRINHQSGSATQTGCCY
jgi:GTPase SAR1 family protein